MLIQVVSRHAYFESEYLSGAKIQDCVSMMWIIPWTNMTLTRRRVRVSKYNILVNTVGAVVGAKLSYIYFINIKQLLNTVIWRTDSPPNNIEYIHKNSWNVTYIYIIAWIFVIICLDLSIQRKYIIGGYIGG